MKTGFGIVFYQVGEASEKREPLVVPIGFKGESTTGEAEDSAPGVGGAVHCLPVAATRPMTDVWNIKSSCSDDWQRFVREAGEFGGEDGWFDAPFLLGAGDNGRNQWQRR